MQDERRAELIERIGALDAGELRGWAEALRAGLSGPDRPFPGEWAALHARARQLGVAL